MPLLGPVGVVGALNAKALMDAALGGLRLPRVRPDGGLEEPPRAPRAAFQTMLLQADLHQADLHAGPSVHTLPVMLQDQLGAEGKSLDAPEHAQHVTQTVDSTMPQAITDAIPKDSFGVQEGLKNLSKRFAIDIGMMLLYLLVGYCIAFAGTSEPPNGGGHNGLAAGRRLRLLERDVPNLAQATTAPAGPASSMRTVADTTATIHLSPALVLHQAPVADDTQMLTTGGSHLSPMGEALDTTTAATTATTSWVPVTILGSLSMQVKDPGDFCLDPVTAQATAIVLRRGIPGLASENRTSVACTAASSGSSGMVTQDFAISVPLREDADTVMKVLTMVSQEGSDVQRRINEELSTLGSRRFATHVAVSTPRKVVGELPPTTPSPQQSALLAVKTEQAERWMGSPLRFWVIYLGAFFSALLAFKNGVYMTNVIGPLVYHVEFAVREALERLKTNLSNEVTETIREANSFEANSGVFCSKPRKVQPADLDEAASSIIKDFQEGITSSERGISYQALPPWWCESRCRLLSLTAGPMLLMVLFKLFYDLAGVVPPALSAQSLPEREFDGLPGAPEGIVECATEGQDCVCSGLIFHGPRFARPAMRPGQTPASFMCPATPKGKPDRCFCAPRGPSEYQFVNGAKLVSLSVHMDHLNFFQLSSSEVRQKSVEKAMREAVAGLAGLWVTPAHVRVFFSPGSVFMRALILPPECGVDVLELKDVVVASLQFMRPVVYMHLNQVDDIESALTGPLVIDIVNQPEVVASPGSLPETWGGMSARRASAASQEIRCPDGFYQTGPLILPCEGEQLTLKQSIMLNSSQIVLRVPQGTMDFTAELHAPADQPVEVLLSDRDNSSSRMYVAGHRLPLTPTVSFGGTQFSIQCKDDGVTSITDIKSNNGSLGFTLDLWVANQEAEPVPMSIHFTYSGISPCPSPIPGCSELTSAKSAEAAGGCQSSKQGLALVGDSPSLQERTLLLSHMWGTVTLNVLFGLIASWPLTRYLANDALRIMEGKVREEMHESIWAKIPGGIHGIQRRVDALARQKAAMQKEGAESRCSTQ